jgi:hypothetical protein
MTETGGRPGPPRRKRGHGSHCRKDCICLCHRGDHYAHRDRKCRELTNAEKIESAVRGKVVTDA